MDSASPTSVRRNRHWAVLAAAAALTVLPASGLLAQTPASSKQPMQPPTPPASTTQASAPWEQWLLAVGLLLLIVGVNCVPSKRGHQD